MEGFTGAVPGNFQKGDQPGDLGTEGPQKLKQNMKFV